MSRQPQQPAGVRNTQNPPVSTFISTSCDSRNTAVLLQTARAKVHRVDRENAVCNVRLILDSCSQKSYVTRKLKERLQIPTISTDKVLIKEFGNESGTLKHCDSVQIAVKGADNLTVFINAYVVDNICSPISNQVIDLAKLKYPHLSDLPLADSGNGNEDLEVEILVGADYLWNFMLDHVVRGEPAVGPVATLTRFCYVLSGPVQVPANLEHSTNVTIAHVLKTDALLQNNDSDLKNQLHKFWDYETLGLKPDEADNSLENPLEGKIKFDGKRYEISLPFKEGHPTIPDNYNVARSRLASLLNRLKSKPEVFERYNAVIQEQLEAGVVERVDENEDLKSPGEVPYIPHREIIREDRETTKLRVVYDASSKTKGEVSLNDCLEPGPNLAPLIFDILLRFRTHKIALIGDIEKAFLNISISPEQRDLLRFLWVDNKDLENPKLSRSNFRNLFSASQPRRSV